MIYDRIFAFFGGLGGLYGLDTEVVDYVYPIPIPIPILYRFIEVEGLSGLHLQLPAATFKALEPYQIAQAERGVPAVVLGMGFQVCRCPQGAESSAYAEDASAAS